MATQSAISPVSPSLTEIPETPRYSSFTNNGESSTSSAVKIADQETSHPFAKSSSLLVVIPNNDGIDVEAEARFYDDLMIDHERYFSAPRKSVSAPSSPQHAASLLSHDIFLEDNTGNSDAFARSVLINGWTCVGDKKGGAYVVYDCVIRTAQNNTIRAHKRYSAFLDLHQALRSTLPPNMQHNVPSLPPKSPFAKFRPSFLDKRRRLLQQWLTAVLLHPEIGGLPIVRQWVME